MNRMNEMCHMYLQFHMLQTLQFYTEARVWSVGFYVFAVLQLRYPFFRDMTLCQWANGFQHCKTTQWSHLQGSNVQDRQSDRRRWSWSTAVDKRKKKMFQAWNGSLMNINSVANYATFSFVTKKKVYRQLPAKNRWVKIHLREVDKYCSFV